MSAKEYFESVIELYKTAQKGRDLADNVFRGRIQSVASDLEELTAKYIIRLKQFKGYRIFVDQPITISEGKSGIKYPDLIIQKPSGYINHLVDLKTDLGWKRDDTLKHCTK